MSEVSTKRLTVFSIVFLLLLILLAWFVDWETVIRMLRGISRWQLGLASVFLVLGFIAYAQRWRLLLERKSRLISTFHASNAGNLVNTLLPLRPGDAARIVLLGAEDNLSMLLITSSIVVERWFEQIMRLITLTSAMFFGLGMAISVSNVIGLLAIIVGLYILMLWIIRKRDFVVRVCPGWLARIPRVNEDSACTALGNIIDGLAGVSSARYLMTLLVWSCITWGLFGVFHFLVLSALDISLSPQIMLAVSLGSLALVPPSASTLPGVFQVSMVVPLALLGYDENMLTSYALVLNILEMLWISILGIWGIFKGGYSLRRLISKN